MKIRFAVGAALRACLRFALLALVLAAPAVHAATPTFDSTCGGCHVSPPEGGRLNASYSSAFIAKAIADNYGPGMNSLSGVSAGTLATIATELGDYFGVSPQAATVPFQTTTHISLVGKVELGSAYAQLNSINVTIAASAGSASAVSTAGSEAINYTPPACTVGSRSFTYNATSSTSGQTTSTRTINVTISNPTTGPTFISPPASMSAQTGVAVTPISFTTSCNALVTYSLASGSLPTGMSLSSGGQVSGTPASSNAAGTYNVSVRATYPGGTSNTTPFAVNLTLGPPDLSGSAATATGLEGSVFTMYQIVATNGSSFTYSATGLPAGLNINTSNGQITGTPSVTANTGASTVYPVTIGANNGTLGSTRVVNFTINAKPVVTSPPTASGQTLVPFTYTITATKTPTAYSATGLPPGVNLPPGSNVISGTPTTVGVYNASITASNASGASAAFALTITITLGPPSITSSLSASAGEGQPFNYQITASNPPLTSYNATGLPSGLLVDPNTGVISGTPAAGAAAGSPYNVTVSATNATGTGSATLVINLSQFPPVPTGGSTNGQTGVAFNYQIVATNAPTAYTAVGLPPGLAVNGTGLISGTPTQVGSFPVTIGASNGSGGNTAALTINVTLGPPVITSAGTASGAAGFAFSYQITATNNPATFNATGLPPGVTVNTTTGLLSGTPAGNGTFNVTLAATNATATANKALVITIAFGLPVVNSAATATAASGAPFSYQITATNGPTSFSASNLPAGLAVDATTGLITGQLANFGVYDFTVQASNGTGSGSRQVTLTVTQTAPGMTSSTSASGAVGQPFTFQVTASSGPVRVDAKGLPAGLAIDPATGLITGTPTAGGTFTVMLSIANARATVTSSLVITVAFKLPTAQDVSVDVAYETPTPIELPVSGQVTQVTLVSQPTHGLVTVAGSTASYTPADGYSGPDSFTYTVTNPAGTTQAATVRLNVGTQVPVASAASMVCDLNSSATADLKRYIKASGLTGVAITAPPSHGKVAVNGTQVTYTPNLDYFGADAFSYVAFGNAGKSSPAVVSVTVIGRPDPTHDANVTGLMDAQAQAARRFTSAQVDNFQRRLETLHRAPPPAPQSAEVGSTARAVAAAAPAPASADSVTAGSRAPTVGLIPASLISPFATLASSRAFDLAAMGGGGGAPSRDAWSGLAAWVGGTAQFGRRDERGDVAGLKFSSDGLSVGVDRRMSERLVLGLGVGYGRDDTDVGHDGTRSRASGQSFALYGSWQPSAATFVDLVLGTGSLDFDTRRYVAAIDQLASGRRKGDQAFASVSAGIELRNENLLLAPYGRVDVMRDRLKAYSDSGVGDYALAYDAMDVKSTQVAAGLRAESQHGADFGLIVPRVRLEYRRELQGEARGTLRYLDLADGPQYSVTTAGVSRNALLLGVGSDLVFRGGLKIGIDYAAQRASGANNVQAVRIFVSQDLDARGSPFAWEPRMFKDPVGVEGGYTYDDNVTRGRWSGDQRADSIFSLAVGEPIPVRIGASPHLRLVLTPQVTGEKFRVYSGLGRASAGLQAELQYRSSGAFDAMTYALVGRAAYDQYESTIRRGARYFVGLNARRSLTDRIDVFAEAGRAMREGKSDVFQTREWQAKLNLDYSLGAKRGVVYLAGEYRHGDIVSSGGSSLVNVGLAQVFTPDDAYPGLDFFAYRFDGRTVLGTLGWNYPLGPRDSLDLSLRRVQSTPAGHTVFDSGTLRYIDNQYSLVYLLRF